MPTGKVGGRYQIDSKKNQTKKQNSQLRYKQISRTYSATVNVIRFWRLHMFYIRRIKQFYTFSFQPINFLKLELNTEINPFDYMSQFNVFISFVRTDIPIPWFKNYFILLCWSALWINLKSPHRGFLLEGHKLLAHDDHHWF